MKVFIAHDQFNAMVTVVLDNKLLKENHQGENVAMIYIKEANRSMITALQAANIREFYKVNLKGLIFKKCGPQEMERRKIQDEYVHNIEDHWPILWYCDNH